MTMKIVFDITTGYKPGAIVQSFVDTSEKVKTFGASRPYVRESEVTSYRDLGLHQISDRDRWLGHGWILDLAEIDHASPTR